MVKQIKSFALSHLTIGATCDFHTKVNKLIVAATPSLLHIEELAPQYHEVLQQLASIVNRSTAFVSTSGMKTFDKTRDNLVGVISNVSRDHKTNPIPAKQSAAITLSAEIAPYKGMGNHEYSKQSAEIRGMLAMLALPENAAAIETLGLADEVAELAKANEAFEKAFLAKANEASSRQAQTDLSSTEICNKINDIYAQIVQTVNAYAIVKTSAEIEKFIDDANGLVILYASIGGGSSSGGSAPGNGGGSTPDGGGGGGGEDDRPVIE